jgi:short-subunit dehydrogenase
MSRRALVLGAKSAIAQAIVRRLAQEGYDFILAARRVAQLEPFAADLKLRQGRQADLVEFEALDFDALAALPGRLREQFGDFELVILVFGYLGDQQKTLTDTGEMQKVLHTNFTAAAIALSHLAAHLEQRQQPGGIIAVSSVAGDRGRQSNYFYGSAKGGLSLFLQGLRNRLSATPVHVLTVKPGFVDTPMTQGLEGLFLVASPDKVADDIVRAYRKKSDVLYTPWFWRWIMCLIRNIPERLFKKMRL